MVAAASAPLQIRVVVVTTFEVGKDTGDEPGEFQNWVEHYPLSEVLPVSPGLSPLALQSHGPRAGHRDRGRQVPRSRLNHGAWPRPALRLQQGRLTYWILAGIAGIDPRRASARLRRLGEPPVVGR